MKIYVNKEDVKKSIININNSYPTVFNNLKAANNIFSEMHSYWYGERYKKMIAIWNKVVVELNGQLDTLAQIVRSMSIMLQNYSTADTDIQKIAYVAPQKLTTCQQNPDPNINIDTARLTTSNTSLLKQIDAATAATNDIMNFAIHADWKSPAVDTFNTELKSLKTELLDSLSTIKKSVNENLTTTVQEFSDANNANAGK